MKINTPLYVRGSHITQFGELWDRSLEDLAHEAVTTAVKNAGIAQKEVQAVFVGNMAASQFESQAHLGALVSHFFPHHPPAVRVEAACASGGVALLQAYTALLSGLYETVVVVGVEKMTDGAADVTAILSAAAHQSLEYGSTFPGLYALLAKAHMETYQTPRRALSMISAKNHTHALTNTKAQFRRKISPEMVESSMLVADPLTVLDCSPVSDGAAAVVLSVKKNKKNSCIKVTGFGQGQDSLDLAQRKSLTSLSSTKAAAKKAYAMAGLSATDIQVAEVHDCFTIAELLAMEDLGVCKPGLAAELVMQHKTSLANKNKQVPVINHSGGLKACGHPVGATGVKQVAYLSELLSKGTFSIALAHNVGGSGATAVVSILEREG